MRGRTTRLLLLVVMGAMASAPGQTIADIRITAGPEAIASFGAAVHDGWVYVLGGHVGRAHHHSRENLSRHFFRVATDDPSRVETLPGGDALQGLALVEAAGHLYRIGGLRALNHPEDEGVLRSEDAVMRYDPTRRVWRADGPLPDPRSSHDAATVDGDVYVFGGWNHAGGVENWHDHGLRGVIRNGTLAWERIEQPFTRRACAVAARGSKLYVIGGLTPDGSPSSRVDVYAPGKGEWTRGPDLPSMGFGAAAFGTPQGLFVTVLSGAVLRLADDEESWETAGHLAFPRFFSRLLPAGEDRLVCFAGAGRIGHVATFEWITLDDAGDAPRDTAASTSGDGEKPAAERGGTTRERIGHFPIDHDEDTGPGPFVHLELPNPVPAKNRQIIFRDRNWLYLFGGNGSLAQHDFDRHDFMTEGVRVDLGSLAVEMVPSLPRPLQSAAAQVVGTGALARAWVLGGFAHDATGESGARSREEIFTYDPTAREWRRRGTLPVPLTQFGLAEHDEELWIFGGLDYDPTRGRKQSFAHSDKVYRAEVSLTDDLEFVETEHPMPVPRRAFGGAALDGRYYVCGGMREDFEVVESFLAFDFETGEWSELPAPSPRISPHLVPLGGKLYLIGGSALDEELEASPAQAIEVYDPDTESWSVHPRTLPVSARHLRAFACAGRLCLLSTHNESNELDLLILRP